MLISEAFDAYRDNYIRLRNQSSRTEEIHEACKRLFLLSVPDKPVDQLTLEDVSLDTTMMYAHVVDHDLQRQYEKYHTI